MLLRSIREGTFVPPLERKGHLPFDMDLRAIKRAPKITPEDRHIDWNTWTAERILRTHKAVGHLWSMVCFADERAFAKEALRRRVNWSSGFEKVDGPFVSGVEPGFPFLKSRGKEDASAYIQTCDNKCLEVKQMTIEGGRKSSPESSSRHAGAFSGNIVQQAREREDGGSVYALFHLPLL